MICWLTKINGKIRISDIEVHKDTATNKVITIGPPSFVFQLEELLTDSEKAFFGVKEGQSKKMVLKEWPIE